MSEPVRWGACSDVGLVRRVNEDSKCHEYPLFAVADGMGGHSAGDVASALAIETLSEQMRSSDSLSDAVRAANQAIFRRAAQEPELSGMGTTITALLAGESSAQIAHVGDSRAYLLRDGQLSRLTQDHTVVGRLVQQGRIHPEDADRHPQRSYLERALGVDSDVEVDVHVLDFKPADRVLLCSDGLFGMIDDELIASVLKNEEDPQKAAEKLCREAVGAGGSDNVTVVIVDFPKVPPHPGVAGSTAHQSAAGVRTDTGPLPGGTAIRAGPTGGSPSSSPPGPGPGPSAEAPQQADPDGAGGPKRRWIPILRNTSIVVAILVIGAIAARVSLQDSWYVGDDDGRVSIFSGVPGNLAGLSLSELQERTDLVVADVPEPHRSRLKEGIPAEDLPSAERIVANLTQLSVSEPSPAPTASPTAGGEAGDPSPGPEATPAGAS